jgi:hypothetical protein
LFFTFPFGCAGNQHTLNLTDLPRPVFIGDRISSNASIDTILVHRIRSVLCYTTHEKEGETVSEGKHVTLYKDEYDLIEENISIRIDTVLQNYPRRFLGNVHVIAEVDRGVSLGAIFTTILGLFVDGGDGELGIYSDQSFDISATIYEIVKEKEQDEIEN